MKCLASRHACCHSISTRIPRCQLDGRAINGCRLWRPSCQNHKKSPESRSVVQVMVASYLSNISPIKPQSFMEITIFWAPLSGDVNYWLLNTGRAVFPWFSFGSPVYHPGTCSIECCCYTKLLLFLEFSWSFRQLPMPIHIFVEILCGWCKLYVINSSWGSCRGETCWRRSVYVKQISDHENVYLMLWCFS